MRSCSHFKFVNHLASHLAIQGEKGEGGQTSVSRDVRCWICALSCSLLRNCCSCCLSLAVSRSRSAWLKEEDSILCGRE